ncbi:MAG: hypothetical protein KAU36_00075, partial [candidate division Zixibacteria bacterium]|nr:hypothetical protein [candidate division Zixibacteria bacterium]
ALFILGENFDLAPRQEAITQTIASLSAGRPKFDQQRKIATVLSEVIQEDGSIVKNLLLMQFYDGGIASFYFYSPDSLFNQSKDSFLDIVTSFSTEALKDTANIQPVEVADLDDNLTGGVSGDETDGSRTILWISMVVMVLILIVARSRKRKKE